MWVITLTLALWVWTIHNFHTYIIICLIRQSLSLTFPILTGFRMLFVARYSLISKQISEICVQCHLWVTMALSSYGTVLLWQAHHPFSLGLATLIWITDSYHWFESQVWTTDLNHRFVSLIWITGLNHWFESQIWTTDLNHRFEPLIWTTDLNH